MSRLAATALRRQPRLLALLLAMLLTMTASSIAWGLALLAPAPSPALATSTAVLGSDSIDSLLARLQVSDPAQLHALAELPILQRLLEAPGQRVEARVDPHGRLQALSAQLPPRDIETAATLQLRVSAQAGGGFNTALSLLSPPPASVQPSAPLLRDFLPSPLPYAPVSSGWGWRINPIFNQPEFHLGIDLAVAVGTPVCTVAAGRVSAAGGGRGYGNYVRVEHPGGYATLYAHLDHINVQVGQHLNQGQLLGYSGNSGWSTGPHLYWQLFVDGTPVDPQTIARADPRTQPQRHVAARN